nr:MAG TPA: hypothetical protein [Caudoviricetes sp.]
MGKRTNTARWTGKLTDQDLQEVINNAYTAGRSRKVLKLLAADMRAFCKYCRKAKLSAYIPEDLKIPAGARYKGKTILQPADLVKLFNVDTPSSAPKKSTQERKFLGAFFLLYSTFYRTAYRSALLLSKYSIMCSSTLPPCCHAAKPVPLYAWCCITSS